MNPCCKREGCEFIKDDPCFYREPETGQCLNAARVMGMISESENKPANERVLVALALGILFIGIAIGYFVAPVERIPNKITVEEQIKLWLAWRNENIKVDDGAIIMEIQVDGWDYVVALKPYEHLGYLKMNFNYWRVEK
jgi:hypothetical protein